MGVRVSQPGLILGILRSRLDPAQAWIEQGKRKENSKTRQRERDKAGVGNTQGTTEDPPSAVGTLEAAASPPRTALFDTALRTSALPYSSRASTVSMDISPCFSILGR